MLCRLDDPSPGASELLEPGSQLGVKPAVLEGDSGHRLHAVEQLGFVHQRGIVNERSDVDAVAIDQRRRSPVQVGQLQRPAVAIDVHAEIGQPVRDLQGGVTQRASERVAQIGGRRLGWELQQQVPHRRAREACVQEAGEEHERCEAERCECGPPDLLHGRTIEGSRHVQQRDHHEPERERVHDENARATHRPASASPACQEDGHAGKAEAAHRQERNAKPEERCVRVGGDLEEVVRTESAERHPDHLQDHSRDIRARDEGTLRGPGQVSRRERQEHVQEEDRRQKIERLAEGERQVVRRPRQRRDEVREPRRDHQSAEAAVRPPPPRVDAAEHVGDGQPVGEQRDDERLAELGAHRRVLECRGKGIRRSCTADEGDRQEHERPRRRTRVAQILMERCCGGDSRAASVLSPFVRRYSRTCPGARSAATRDWPGSGGASSGRARRAAGR